MVYPQSLDGMSLRHSIDEDIPEDLRPAPGGSWGTPCVGGGGGQRTAGLQAVPLVEGQSDVKRIAVRRLHDALAREAERVRRRKSRRTGDAQQRQPKLIGKDDLVELQDQRSFPSQGKTTNQKEETKGQILRAITVQTCMHVEGEGEQLRRAGVPHEQVWGGRGVDAEVRDGHLITREICQRPRRCSRMQNTLRLACLSRELFHTSGDLPGRPARWILFACVPRGFCALIPFKPALEMSYTTCVAKRFDELFGLRPPPGEHGPST
eukprot:scaffold63_cov306-Pinguiococcus_pyrenoidosus.AAC.46